MIFVLFSTDHRLCALNCVVSRTTHLLICIFFLMTIMSFQKRTNKFTQKGSYNCRQMKSILLSTRVMTMIRFLQKKKRIVKSTRRNSLNIRFFVDM